MPKCWLLTASCQKPSNNPAAADHDISIIENRGLSGSDGTLRLVECCKHLVAGVPADNGGSGCVLIANSHCHPHRLAQLFDSDPVQAACVESVRVKVLAFAHDDLASVSANFQNIERISSSHAEPLALSYREVVDAGM